jgi:hypothetical protein
MTDDGTGDLFASLPLAVARRNADQFTTEFMDYLPANLHVYSAFEKEAFKITARGFQHYSARTIIHVLRHHSALTEKAGDGWKLNDHVSPYLARLFALLHPRHADLFEYREAKAAKRDQTDDGSTAHP